MLKQRVLLIMFVGLISACSQNELKNFAKQTVHNVGCDQNYEHQHKHDQMRDDCLRNRP